MNAIVCPLCTGDATVDDRATRVTCETCGVVVAVAADPPTVLEAAA
jgi:ribosomal protein S27E